MNHPSQEGVHYIPTPVCCNSNWICCSSTSTSSMHQPISSINIQSIIRIQQPPPDHYQQRLQNNRSNHRFNHKRQTLDWFTDKSRGDSRPPQRRSLPFHVCKIFGKRGQDIRLSELCFMDRWTGIVKVPVFPKATSHCRVAASLCISPQSKELTVPSANAIFFNGDRVEGTGNPVIERLSELQRIADVLVSKFGGSVNAWVIEASTFNGPFAVYKEFIPSLNRWGEPLFYKADGFPASTSTITLLLKFLEESAKRVTKKEGSESELSESHSLLPDTYILGFSKGGTVVNQLVTELSFSKTKSMEDPLPEMSGWALRKMQGRKIIPISRESFLDSITEIHYVDVGLNSAGAYVTEDSVIKGLGEQVRLREKGIRFVLHGTPRQWCDSRRSSIRREKDKFARLLESEAHRSGGKLQACERFYFAG
ncbi:hypothetical protein Nepgr_023484 [Nepenthes gracilis]|uniref:Uncharacterized protein n=1 Tax=Nepenthes gracilis TaxID=150966 RepID=A0AAD3XXR7_NEPGR|nr:hypothetical protein Nepgr_023484 [Nepenthes gracilis]